MKFIVKGNGRFEVREGEPFEGEEVVTKLVKNVALLSGPSQTVEICQGEDGYFYILVSDGFNVIVAGRYETFETLDRRE